jgi:hypothetical protein
MKGISGLRRFLRVEWGGCFQCWNLRYDESRTDWFLVMREVVVMDPR